MRALRPDWYHAEVGSITVELLRGHGVRGVLVDLDNTLVSRDDDSIPPAAVEWVRTLHAAGIGVCLLSNNWHHRVSRVADRLGCPSVSKALKPLPFAFGRACRILGVPCRDVAVVGDQVFTDILGGNLCSALTVLVVPLRGSDLPHTLLLRRLEAAIMAGRTPATGVGSQAAKGTGE